MTKKSNISSLKSDGKNSAKNQRKSISADNKKTVFANKNTSVFLSVVLFLSFICFGAFHEATSALLSVILCVMLFVLSKKDSGLIFYIGYSSLTVTAVVFFYALVLFWATDKGCAPIGFIKYLPVFLFMLLYMQTENAEIKIFSLLPHFAVAMTLISALLMQIGIFEDYFSVAGRLSGFFEYPNTFALFSLISLLFLLTSKHMKWYGYIEAAILLLGILYSGSRIVFVLTVISVVASLFITKSKKRILTVIPIIFIPIVLIVIYVIVSKKTDAFSRFMTTSLMSSTFIGRLLYISDASKEIIRHPFGSGYLSYFLTQQKFQTAVYSIRYIHNDYLQLAYDIGIVPAVMFAGMILKNIFSKKTSGAKRLILFVFAFHMFFDFDIEFVSMFFLLILLCDVKDGRRVNLKNLISLPSVVLFAVFTLYVGSSLAMSFVGALEKSVRIYPWNTETNMLLMYTCEDAGKVALAEKIIMQNKYVSSAYMVKATDCFSKGDFKNFIKYSSTAIDLAPYVYENYETTAYMLIYGIDLYEKSGDYQSADKCKKALVEAFEKFESAKNSISSADKYIKDKFETSLPEAVSSYTAQLKEGD